MERFDLKPGIDWPGWQGGRIVAVCHWAEHSVIVRQDEDNSALGDPRLVAHLVTDYSVTNNEAYQSYYALKPHQVPHVIHQTTPMCIGESSR